MNLTRTLIASSLLALPLCAGDGKTITFEAQASAVIAAQDTNRMVSGNNLTGATLGVGLRHELAAGLSQRLTVNLLGMKGAFGTGLEGAAPKHLNIGWDIIQDVDKWSFYGGVLGIKWKQTIDANTLNAYRDFNAAGTANGNNEPKGWKFGGRLGVERALTKHVSFSMNFTQTEFNKKLNPSWYSLGFLYKF